MPPPMRLSRDLLIRGIIYQLQERAYGGLSKAAARKLEQAAAGPPSRGAAKPTPATYSGKYPVARYLYIYLNKKPNEPLDPLRAEFIKYILSKDGQTLTEEGGYFPITNEIRENDLDRLGILPPAN